MHKLRYALRITERSTVAIVGAGGKTSAMFLLARQFPFAFITTSTHLLGGQGDFADQHLILPSNGDFDSTKLTISKGVLMVTGELDPEKYRFLPPTEAQLSQIKHFANGKKVPLFIEADGARHRSIKAPGNHEPAIPSFVDTVILVAGMSVFGQPLTDQIAHRPEIFANLGGLQEGDEITAESFINVLTHALGGLKNIPDSAKRHVLLTQPNDASAMEIGKQIAEGVLGTWDSIVIADTKDTSGEVLYSRKWIGGVVLAAGQSTRYGKQKIYESYQGETFLRKVCQSALTALDQVVVVLPAGDTRGEQELSGLPVTIVYNQRASLGQSESIKVGLQNLSKFCAGAIFLHADQPQTSPFLIRALSDEGAKTSAAIIAPMIDGERGTPVYFDSSTFSALNQIEGDQGGKQIFHLYSIHYLPWLDKKQLIDIDNPDDLERLNDA